MHCHAPHKQKTEENETNGDTKLSFYLVAKESLWLRCVRYLMFLLNFIKGLGGFIFILQKF